MKHNLPLLFVIVTVISLIVIGVLHSDARASDNSKSISTAQSKVQATSNGRCPAYVRFEINNIQYQVDANYHTGFQWGDLDGAKHRREELINETSKCKSVQVGKVKYIGMAGEKGVIITSGKEDLTTSYQMHINAISEARDNNQTVEVGDGIEKIVINGRDLYILPQSVAKTANNEPVLIDCAGGNRLRVSEFARCGLLFMHTDGNYIGEGFRKLNFPEGKLLDAYQRTLDYYNHFKIEKED